MNYLFRISTEQRGVLSSVKPKPIYFVCRTKEGAQKWAEENLHSDLKVKRITKLAAQCATTIFVPE